MAVTRQEVQAAFDAAYAANEMTLKEMQASLDQLKAIDPASPDAQSKFDTIQQEYQAVRDTFNNGNAGLRQKWSDLDQAWRDAHGGESFTVIPWNALVDKINQTSADRKATVSIKQTEIANAKKAAANGGTPGVTANLAPTVNIAPDPTAVKNKITGSGDDDSSKKNDPGKNQPTITVTTDSKTGIETVDVEAKRDKNTNKEKPGKRLYNPLGDYPSYTYNLSLYMLTPDAYDGFVKSGRKNLDTSPGGSGAVIIAQSGGINNTNQQRGTGFTMDYYIDNLRIVTITNGKDSETATNTTEISFNITEPYGFSFISNLKRAADDLITKSQAKGIKNLGNATRQFFMLGIRFIGYDQQGNVITKDDGLGERFYDIMITKMSFKLDNKATVYSIQAASMAPGTAFGVKRGIWDTGGTVRGATVYDMLKDMCNQMNQQAKELSKNSTVRPNTYSFKFMPAGDGEDEQKTSPIFNASMKSQTDIDKQKLPGSNARKAAESNDKAAASATPDLAARELSIPKGTPILQAFELIISRSTYIEDAFKVLQTSALENDPKNPKKDINKPTDSQDKIRWYNVSAECTNAQYDEKIQDFTWDIKYIFRVYETPVVDNPYSNLGINYYGPHKRYKYWYTGKNSEIISYTQTLDNTFFNAAVAVPDPDNNSSTANPATATSPGKQADAPRTDSVNQQNQGKSAFLASLFDPGAYAKANLKILGDPDFLMPESTSSVNNVYNQFYGTDGYTVSANGGQVFIEIDFKEAQDYNYASDDGITYKSTNDGLMSLNDKIQFWKYPTEIDDQVEGVSFMVLRVVSTFGNGKFEQDLDLTVNTFPGYAPKVPEQTTQGQTTESRENQNPNASSQNPNTGDLTKEAPISTPAASNNTGNGSANQTATNGGTQPTVNTPAGPVANDDGLAEVSITSKRVGQDQGRNTGPTFDGTNWYDENGNVIPPRS